MEAVSDEDFARKQHCNAFSEHRLVVEISFKLYLMEDSISIIFGDVLTLCLNCGPCCVEDEL